MADFEIRRDVWLHNRVFKRGQEEALQEAGFTKKDKQRYERRGHIRLVESEAAPQAEAAPEDLSEKNVDELRDIARERGIPYSGRRKDELVAALSE